MSGGLSRLLRRAVRLSTLLSAPVLVGCGGGHSSAVCTLGSAEPLGPPNCGSANFDLNGSIQSCGADETGIIPSERCATLCPPSGGAQAFACSIFDGGDDSGNELECDYTRCYTGRRPAGLEASEQHNALSPVAQFLAEGARLEAASVHAFVMLERELRAHGAPAGLRARALRAAHDEARHARLMLALAKRSGASVRPVRVADTSAQRSLESLAIENATEGCVRETLGAAVAHFQARRANDSRVRSVMARIAGDETRHAALSWELARWFDCRLDPDARRRVRDALDRAVEAVAPSPKLRLEASVIFELGMPTPAQAMVLWSVLRARLWPSTQARPQPFAAS